MELPGRFAVKFPFLLYMLQQYDHISNREVYLTRTMYYSVLTTTADELCLQVCVPIWALRSVNDTIRTNNITK